jgi:hypothetical protein
VQTLSDRGRSCQTGTAHALHARVARKPEASKVLENPKISGLGSIARGPTKAWVMALSTRLVVSPARFRRIRFVTSGLNSSRSCGGIQTFRFEVGVAYQPIAGPTETGDQQSDEFFSCRRDSGRGQRESRRSAETTRLDYKRGEVGGALQHPRYCRYPITGRHNSKIAVSLLDG